MRKILSVVILLFLINNIVNAQEYTNAQLGLPDLSQVATVAKSATDALPFGDLGNTFADTLSYLLSIANTGFKPVEIDNLSNKHYMRASTAYGPVFQKNRKVYLSFQYDALSFKKGPIAQYALEQVADFAKKLAATDISYKIGHSKGKSQEAYTLWFGKDAILGWSIDLEKHGVPYPIFQISFWSKSFALLADEVPYKGKFPSEVLNQCEPQIWEIRGKGKTSDSYQRFNGIFKDGYLISGSKTFHGYGKFYDGTWMSNEWLRPIYYGMFDVTFVPEGSKDTIDGYFWHGGMGEFVMRENYSHFTADSHGWVNETYIPYKTKFDALRQQTQDRNKAAASSYSGYPQNNNNTTNNNSSGSGRTNSSSFSKCSVCNGHGYTEYDCGGGGGHPCRKYCSACNGTGQVHN